jgi:hypothetical protein
MQARVVSEEKARKAHRCLQGVWLIVSANHDDALARDVAALGERLKAAIEASDWQGAHDCCEEIRSWLSISAGTVISRLQHVFES